MKCNMPRALESSRYSRLFTRPLTCTPPPTDAPTGISSFTWLKQSCWFPPPRADTTGRGGVPNLMKDACSQPAKHLGLSVIGPCPFVIRLLSSQFPDTSWIHPLLLSSQGVSWREPPSPCACLCPLSPWQPAIFSKPKPAHLRNRQKGEKNTSKPAEGRTE